MENLNFWVKKLDPYFEELDEIPLFRGESFSFEDLANSIKKELHLENLSLSCKVNGWQKQEDIKKILGDNPNQICLTFTPLMGNVYILMNKTDVKSLTSSLLSTTEKNNFSSNVLEEGFYRFLTLFTLDHIKKTATFQGLSPKIVEDAEIKSQEAFCLDITIETKADTSIHALIAITPDFKKYWNDFFSSKKSIILSKVKNNIEVLIQIVAGHTFLKKNEWGSVKEGDFIVLDRSYIDLDADNNKVMFTLNENPIFIAKILKNKIHILDYASYHEEDEYMEQKSNKNSNHSENIPENTEEREELQDLLDEEPSSETNVTILSEEISPMKDIPFKLTVEVAKISISLEKLIELQPGNFLKLPVSPENPVNLTVNGKKIGTAEITKLGETFGIRILQIG